MRLSTLDACIQDALETRQALTDQINSIFASSSQQRSAIDSLPSAQDHLASISGAVRSTRKQVESLRNQTTHLRRSLHTRRGTVRNGHRSHSHARQTLDEYRSELRQSRNRHPHILDSIAGQRRRVCLYLHTIYPIEPLPDRRPTSLAFSIRGLHLPNSAFTSPDLREDEISAALGYVAHLVHMLSCYLCVPLPYPITPRGSSSTIYDLISKLSTPSITSPSVGPVFPLHLSNGTRGARRVVGAIGGTSFYRFEYGVFLLNKDIELLATEIGLKLLDIRQTLPNVKYIIVVATAGKGEAPGRKAGGIRGLLKGAGASSLDGSRDSSRRGSQESADRTPNLRAMVNDKGKGKLVDGRVRKERDEVNGQSGEISGSTRGLRDAL